MPRFMYSRFLREMEKSVSVITTDQSPMDDEVVDSIARSIGAETIGLVTHSGVRPSIVSNSRIERCIMLDPIAVPHINTQDGVHAPCVTPSSPTHVIRTGGDAEGMVANAISLRVNGASESMYDQAGQSDVLDNIFARVFNGIGMNGRSNAAPTIQSYDQWNGIVGSKPAHESRNEFRKRIVKECVDFLMHRSHSIIKTAEVVEDS
jgi:hypothetical protein